jgi:hypothetical protein
MRSENTFVASLMHDATEYSARCTPIDVGNLQRVSELEVHVSLFESSSGMLAFSVIESEMIVVSDLLNAILSHPSTLVARLQGERDALAKIAASTTTQGTDVTRDALEGYESHHIPAAKEDVRSIAEGMATLAVFAFLERSLRYICEMHRDEYEVEQYIKRGSQHSKLERYVLFLEQECGLQLALPEEFTLLKVRQRELRNVFAHGDWDMHYFIARRGCARETFQATVPILNAIEAALSS